ncbi:hypothetical protein B0H63DRAFT_482690 [Podospora didyma]|uniref:Uncharacterized protein n=1 Tax=Podospora didyma TaxID=330526 RepID=A0AAE0KG68_9PEZI|nr:hypothetical protein B0H63DRAFT_482690 [Podospora didyma]
MSCSLARVWFACVAGNGVAKPRKLPPPKANSHSPVRDRSSAVGRNRDLKPGGPRILTTKPKAQVSQGPGSWVCCEARVVSWEEVMGCSGIRNTTATLPVSHEAWSCDVLRFGLVEEQSVVVVFTY